MRTLLLGALVGVSVVSASIAQESSEPPRFAPRYESTGEAPVPTYPPEQLGRRSGVVVLCCTPNASRRLTCTIASEAPERRGFGPAAQRAHQTMRALTEDSYAAYLTAFPNGGAFPVLYALSSTGSGESPPRPDVAAQDAMCAAP